MTATLRIMRHYDTDDYFSAVECQVVDDASFCTERITADA